MIVIKIKIYKHYKQDSDFINIIVSEQILLTLTFSCRHSTRVWTKTDMDL